MKNKYALYGLILLCVACSSERAGLKELKRLCEKDAGLTIYKTVEADGYYDTTGGFDLVLSPYRFYEFCDDSPSPSKFNVIPEPGCYRVEKVKRVGGQCHQGYDEALAKVVVDPYPEFLKEHCIAVEKIEKPEAEYTYLVERKEWWIDESAGTKMTRSRGKIINSKKKEVLGERISYGLFPKGYGTSQSKPHVSCGSYKVTGKTKTIPFATGLIEKTLIAGTTKDKGEMK